MKQKEFIREIANISTEMSELTVDKINEVAPKPEEVEVKLTTKQIAAAENIRYIEPKKRLQAFGELKSEWKKKRDHDWQYVKGMFQSEVINGMSSGEDKCFWFSKWPGDPDCLWEIPVNIPVYVPRMIAYYLSGEKDLDTGLESMKYHTFNYIERPTNSLRSNEFMHQFSVTGTHYRGRFVPLGVFA